MADAKEEKGLQVKSAASILIELEHFEAETFIFKTDQEFIEFVKSCFEENEINENGVNEAGLWIPNTVEECISYIREYCMSFTGIRVTHVEKFLER